MVDEVSTKETKKSRWTTRDIMVTAMVAIALGVIYIPLTYFTGWLMAFPLISGFLSGIYKWPIILSAYLIRKPWTALFSAAVAFLVLVPFTPWGIAVLMFIFTLGLPIELIFLTGRYRNFKLWYLVVTGAIAGLVGSIVQFIVVGVGDLSPLLQIVFFMEAMLGGGIIGGGLAKVTGDAVFKTGILDKISR